MPCAACGIPVDAEWLGPYTDGMGRWARVTVTDPPPAKSPGMHTLPREHNACGWRITSSNNHQSPIILHQFPRDYSVWGQVGAWDSDHPNPYLFTGRRFDTETGLYYHLARYYSEIGRFLQTGPIGYGDGMNMYPYCRNSLVDFVDPRGLAWEDPAVRIVSYNGSDPTNGDQITDAASDPFWDNTAHLNPLTRHTDYTVNSLRLQYNHSG